MIVPKTPVRSPNLREGGGFSPFTEQRTGTIRSGNLSSSAPGFLRLADTGSVDRNEPKHRLGRRAGSHAHRILIVFGVEATASSEESFDDPVELPERISVTSLGVTWNSIGVFVPSMKSFAESTIGTAQRIE